MSRQQAFQSTPTPAEQPNRRGHRIYTVAQLLGPDLLNMSRRTFFRLRGLGQLPFLCEVEPRAGRLLRYRADLVDRYLAGQWNQSRFFNSHKAHATQSAAVSPTSGSPLIRHQERV